MENNRGYSMPLMPSKDDMWEGFLFALLLVLSAAIFTGMTINEEKNIASLSMCVFAGFLGVIAVAMFLVCGFAKLHFVPKGVAITLFGITMKRFPVEKIRLITASQAIYRSRVMNRIALCDYSLEELTAHAHASKPKLFRNSREFRTGEWADEYLTRRLIHGLKPDRRLFWLWWDPERLEALRSMYPQAQWMDLTKDKIFDKQLEDISSGKSQ